MEQKAIWFLCTKAGDNFVDGCPMQGAKGRDFGLCGFVA
jgi:hypothetical protein